MIISAVLDGIGLARIHEDLVAANLASGALVRVLDKWCPCLPGSHLYYPGRRYASALLRAFIDMARPLTTAATNG